MMHWHYSHQLVKIGASCLADKMHFKMTFNFLLYCICILCEINVILIISGNYFTSHSFVHYFTA